MYLLPPEDKLTLNLLGHYDLSDTLRLKGEIKYSKQDLDYPSDPNSYWDLLPGFPDNPFLPAALQPIAANAGQIAITMDPIGFRNRIDTERETLRAVFGVEGSFANGWDYSVTANVGQFNQYTTNSKLCKCTSYKCWKFLWHFYL
jgi:hypothetical protein